LKFLLPTLALAGAMSLCACAGAASPTAPTAAVIPSLMSIGDTFDLAFYQSLTQNGYESPAQLEPVRRLHGPLRLYIRTEDNAGRVIDATTLETTERILVESVGVWSGEQFGIAEIARGTGTREKAPGWLTIKWAGPSSTDRCGRSTVGVDGGFIEFNDQAQCSCGGSSRIYPRLVRHELGHAMGYYHTDQISDVMYGRTISPDGCDLQPSLRERQVAQFVYRQTR
jgi:hypothetical protein